MDNYYHQLSLKDTFSDCKDMFIYDVPSFFQLLEWPEQGCILSGPQATHFSLIFSFCGCSELELSFTSLRIGSPQFSLPLYVRPSWGRGHYTLKSQ